MNSSRAVVSYRDFPGYSVGPPASKPSLQGWIAMSVAPRLHAPFQGVKPQKLVSSIGFSEASSPPWPSASLILVHLLWPEGGRCRPLHQNIGCEGEDGWAIANKGQATRRCWCGCTNAGWNVIKEGGALEEINLIALAYRTN
jgi:hypothetical protein